MSALLSALTIGADPELFVTKNGSFHSAWALIEGNKKKPFIVNRGAVQVDGMALEFNIDPANTEDEFVLSIDTVMGQLAAMVPEYRIVITPVADFGYEYIKSQPEEAKELGCDPDYNAYTGKENPRPNADLPFRTASGHIHVGWTQSANPNDVHHMGMCCTAVKQLDVFLGIPSVLYDNNDLRRQMYGQAGALRPKTYGLEYRVLSNLWLKDEAHKRWVYRQTRAAFEALEAGDFLFEKIGEEEVQRIINTSDRESALKICRDYNLQVVGV